MCSQKEEAMRKLNAAGVVSTKQAFQLKQSSSSQRSAALAAFEQKEGVDVNAGAISRNQLKQSASYKALQPKSGDSTQRRDAMKALEAQLQG